MGTFIGYMIQVAIIMTILYLVYKLLMSGISFHSFNRKIILGIYLVSWILPAFSDLLFQSNSPQANLEIGNLEFTSVIVSDSESVKRFDWTIAFTILYVSGVLIMITATLLSIWRMYTIIRKARLIEDKDFYIKVSEKAPGPFSWGKYIIIRPSDIDETLDMVIRHEDAHLRLLHWIDLIPARLTVILQWFSPAAWLLARELREVHEFEVDEIAANENVYEYQLMLIKKTAGSSFPDIADSLNHSQIKKRLTMMRKKSNPKRRVAALWLPLSAFVALLLISQPLVARIVDRMASVDFSVLADNKIIENERDMQIIRESNGVSNEVKQKLSSSPSVKTPQSNDTGSYSDIESPTISPMQNVKNEHDTRDNNVLIASKHESSTEQKVPSIDKTAQFKGGEKEFLSFLIENIKYPDCEIETQDNTVSVILSFNILTDGSVDDITVKRSGGEAFDTEAIEVVKKTTGRWDPAENNGKPIVSQITIPITFKKKS